MKGRLLAWWHGLTTFHRVGAIHLVNSETAYMCDNAECDFEWWPHPKPWV